MRIEKLAEYQNTIRNKAARLRHAARLVPPLRPVIRSFDGKVYNKRFRAAIEAVKTGESDLHYRVYDASNYFNVSVIREMHYSDTVTLFDGYSCKSAYRRDAEKVIFGESKRIKSDAMIALLDKSYASMLAKAAELERAADALPDTLTKIADTESLLNRLIDALPRDVFYACEINFRYL